MPRPGFNDRFGDTFGIIYGFTAAGFTFRELRDHVEDIRSKLLHVPDVSKIEILGAQDERIFVEFSIKELAALGIDRSALIRALQAQNIVRPGGTIQTGDETLSLRTTGSFVSEQDIADVNFSVAGRMLRLSDIAVVRRASPIRLSRCFASTANPRLDSQSRCGMAVTYSPWAET
jgi:multidrug efflux pump subunit AcrB